MAIETVKRVWIEREGVAIEIADFPDAPDNLQLTPFDKKSAEWFGHLSITLSSVSAVELGHALIACGEEKIKK